MAQLDTIITDFNIGIKGENKLDQVIKTMRKYQEQADKAEKGSMEWMEAQNKLAIANKKFGDEFERASRPVKEWPEMVDANAKSTTKFGGSIFSLARSAIPAIGAIFAADKLLEFGKELLKIEKQYNGLKCTHRANVSQDSKFINKGY